MITEQELIDRKKKCAWWSKYGETGECLAAQPCEHPVPCDGDCVWVKSWLEAHKK